MKTADYQTKSVAATKKLGEAVGRRLQGGEVIELVSDLGGGKTQFVHGLAKGIGSRDTVQSPSFTISRIYRSEQIYAVRELWHFDFYRLDDPGLMRLELSEAIAVAGVVVVIEWAQRVADVLPADRLIVEIITTGENSRKVALKATGPLHSHLLE